MKKRTLLTFILLVTALLSVDAAQRSYQQAKAIAERYVQKAGIRVDGSGMRRTPVKVRKAVKTGEATAESNRFFVFESGSRQGYVIVSGDDLMPEIVGYSKSGNFDEDNLPDGMAYFLKAYGELADKVAAGDVQALRTVREAEALRASSRKRPVVRPLLGDISWDQGEPYNRLAPSLNADTKCATGCVATAMAQIMMFHRWPDVLKADIPAYTTHSYGFTIGGESAGQKIDWSNMLALYVDGQYNDTQAAAVAKLMSLCGKAVEMDYGPSSGANVFAEDMVKFFGYDKELTQYLNRAAFDLEQWQTLLDNELQASRPVLYAGQSSDGGHQFVCDGSDGTGLYHINWGWSGYQDGYFDITVLNPQKGGAGSGSATDGYNRSNDMIIGLQKDNGTVDKPLAEIPAIGYDQWGEGYYVNVSTQRQNSSQPFTVSARMVFSNVSGRDLTNVKVAYGIENGNGVLRPVSTQANCDIRSGYGIIYTANFNYTFPVGRTTVYAVYSLNNGITWKKCMHVYSPITVDATETSLTMVKTSLTAKLTGNNLYTGRENTFSVSVTNNGDTEYNNLIHVFANSTNTRPDEEATSLWVTVPAHGSVTRTFTLTSQGSDVYLWLKTDKSQGDALLVSGQRFELGKQGVPNLVLESVTANNNPYANEEERAFYYGNRVQVPRVDDDKLVVQYRVRNDGEDYFGRVYFNVSTGSADDGSNTSSVDVLFKGNGAVQPFSASIDRSDVVNPLIVTTFWLDNSDGYSLAFAQEPHWYLLMDIANCGYECDMNTNWYYVAGKPTGISAPDAGTSHGLVVVGGRGQITISAQKAQTVSVFSVSGQQVAARRVAAGETVTVDLSSGIYVVNGKKVVVR